MGSSTIPEPPRVDSVAGRVDIRLGGRPLLGTALAAHQAFAGFSSMRRPSERRCAAGIATAPDSDQREPRPMVQRLS